MEGVTSTVATGTGFTVMLAVPLTPSEVAVMVAEPGAMAVTTPDEETVATPVLLELQVTVRPVRVFPLASRVVAVSVVVPPTMSVAEEGLTVTDATGRCVTVTLAVPLTPSDVAVIVAVPGARAVTTPAWETVATDSLLELQLTARPVSTLPFASRVVAVKVELLPSSNESVDGETDTLATGR